MDDDDDIPRLPADTLAALQEFHADKSARAERFAALKSQSESRFAEPSDTHDAAASSKSDQPLSMDLFTEDWNASQFWYTNATALTLARQLLAGATAASRIAVVSAPSVYVALRNLLAATTPSGTAGRPLLRLFEFDDRFAVLGEDFVRYDFREPLRFPADLRGSFDRIICDPPFLSEDCQAKTAVTVRGLARGWTAMEGETGEGEGEGMGDGVRFISCTGERMGETIVRLYGKIGVRMTTFEPEHAQSRLSNEFRCYANFECEDWTWRVAET